MEKGSTTRIFLKHFFSGTTWDFIKNWWGVGEFSYNSGIFKESHGDYGNCKNNGLFLFPLFQSRAKSHASELLLLLEEQKKIVMENQILIQKLQVMEDENSVSSKSGEQKIPGNFVAFDGEQKLKMLTGMLPKRV